MDEDELKEMDELNRLQGREEAIVTFDHCQMGALLHYFASHGKCIGNDFDSD